MSTAGSRGTAGHSLSSIFISSSDDMAAGRDEDGVTKQGCSSSRAGSAHDGSAGGCREGGGLSSSLHEISAHLRRNNVSLRFISRRIRSVKQTARRGRCIGRGDRRTAVCTSPPRTAVGCVRSARQRRGVETACPTREKRQGPRRALVEFVESLVPVRARGLPRALSRCLCPADISPGMHCGNVSSRANAVVICLSVFALWPDIRKSRILSPPAVPEPDVVGYTTRRC